MSTIHTTQSIKNLALDMIGELPITSGSTAVSRFMDRWFEHTVEVELRANTWNFSVDYDETEEDATYTATSRWRYRYLAPNGTLRLLPPTASGERYGRPLDHVVTRSGVLMNSAGPLRGWWVYRVLEPGQWDPLFAQVVISALALAGANKFTGKSSYVQLAAQMRSDALDTAEQVNAIEGSVEPVEQHDILRVRALGQFNPDNPEGIDWL
jgi:hypothetical protein